MGTVIALCAVLLLKWLAVVALVVTGLVVLARGLWRRRYRPLALEMEPAAPRAPEPGLVPVPRPAADPDCSWCGLAGGHHDLLGRPVRPRHAHDVGAVRARGQEVRL